MPERKAPIVIPAVSPPADKAQQGVVIFLHGFGDEGASFEDLAHQVQNAKRLPHVTWIFPSAMESRDMMTTAWASISGLKPIPPNRPELEEDEDEDGLLFSMRYVLGLIDEQVQAGIPVSRIALGGFSQGGAISLLTGLVSKYAGQLAGLLALSSYMPLRKRILELREELETPEVNRLRVFLARGSKDMQLPSSFNPLPKLKELGYDDDQVENHIYENVGHTITGQIISDMCQWLEKLLPEAKA